MRGVVESAGCALVPAARGSEKVTNDHLFAAN